MKIKSRKEKDILIVEYVDKRLDLSGSKDFEEKIKKLIAEGSRKLALDLTHVEFVDSSGLAAIISTLKAVGDRNNLVVFGAHGHVKGLFQLTRMDQVFNMAVTEKEALALLGKGR